MKSNATDSNKSNISLSHLFLILYVFQFAKNSEIRNNILSDLLSFGGELFTKLEEAVATDDSPHQIPVNNNEDNLDHRFQPPKINPVQASNSIVFLIRMSLRFSELNLTSQNFWKRFNHVMMSDEFDQVLILHLTTFTP